MWNNFIIVLVSPSGGGKTTLFKMIYEHVEDIKYSVSATTRPIRNNEKDTENYVFMSEPDFLRKKSEGYFAETAMVHDYMYGTPTGNIAETLHNKNDVIMDLDVIGAMNIKEQYPDAITVFILPPTMDALRDRLIKRGTDSDEVIEKRLLNAEKEMECRKKFDYNLINDNLKTTFEEVCGIIYDERKKRRI